MSVRLEPPLAPHADPLYEKIERLAHEAASRGADAVLTLAQSVHPEPRTLWHAVTLAPDLLIGNIECASAAGAAPLAIHARNAGLEVLLDVSQKSPESSRWRELLGEGGHPYSDLAVWAEATCALVTSLAAPGPLQEVLLIGASPLGDAIQHRLGDLGYDISRAHTILGADPGTPVLLGVSFHRPVVTAAMLEALAADGVAPILIDGGIGTFAAEALALAGERGWLVRRPDMRAALAAHVQQGRQYRHLVERRAGRRLIAGAECVAGGVLGAPGAVVLDRLDQPERVLGWADGQGGLVSDAPEPAWLAAREAVVRALGLAEES